MNKDLGCFNILDEIPNSLIVYNLDNSVEFVNKAFEILTGYKKEKIFSASPPFPWDAGNNSDGINANGLSFLTVEKLYSKANGEKIWIEVTRSRSRSKSKDNDENDIIIECWVNITSRKKTEFDLINYQEQLNLLTNHLEYIREKERKKIAREIHDELGQILTVLKMDIFWTLKKIPEEYGSLIEKSKAMIQLIDEAIKSVQRISLELRPRLLDDFGLAEAIDWQIKQFIEVSHIDCEIIEIPEKIEMDQESAIALYRIIQEILTNIVRHSEATNVKLSLTVEKDMLHLNVIDNGRGIPKEIINDPKALGLIGIKERIKYLDGKFNITCGKNGTSIKVIVPLNKYKELKID